MKTVILAGGLGTRLSEETSTRPKPMVEIGGKPIIWHIMKIYSHHGFNDFIICLGYKGYLIKEFFANYYLHQSDVTIDLQSNTTVVHRSNSEPWKITLVDTGDSTMTGGRLKRVRKYLSEETFMMTYGDGVSNVDINRLVEFHRSQNTLATLTSVKPAGRFGALDIGENKIVQKFTEKPAGDGNWINGGFFVLSSEIFKLIEGDSSIFEKETLQEIAKKNQLSAYHHEGFWMPMDKLSDKLDLEKLWLEGGAPWKVW